MILFCENCKNSLEIQTPLIPTYVFELECTRCHFISRHDLSDTASEITDEEITDPMMESPDQSL